MNRPGHNPSPWKRTILHADMDAFYAAVEQLRDPGLRGRPVIVGGLGNRGVVSTASYEARPFGVHSAMPMALARQRCPQAVFLSPDFASYHEMSGCIMSVFSSFSPRVEPLSLDEAFLDMTGAESLFGPPQSLGRRLKEAVLQATGGLKVSVGISTTKFVAKVASDYDKPDGLTVVPPERVHDFLRPLDVGRLWGAGPKTRERLLQLRLATIGDVSDAPAGLLIAHFGAAGERMHELSRGSDDRDVIPDREAKSIGAEFTLERDVSGLNPLRSHVRRAADKVARHLRRDGFLAAAVRVKLKTADFQLRSRQRALDEATDSSREIEEAALKLLAQMDLSIPIRLVGIAAFRLAGKGAEPLQPSLFGQESRERERKLEETMDALKERFGSKALRWGDDE